MLCLDPGAGVPQREQSRPRAPQLCPDLGGSWGPTASVGAVGAEVCRGFSSLAADKELLGNKPGNWVSAESRLRTGCTFSPCLQDGARRSWERDAAAVGWARTLEGLQAAGVLVSHHRVALSATSGGCGVSGLQRGCVCLCPYQYLCLQCLFLCLYLYMSLFMSISLSSVFCKVGPQLYIHIYIYTLTYVHIFQVYLR